MLPFARLPKPLRGAVKLVLAVLGGEALLVEAYFGLETASLRARANGVHFNDSPDRPSWWRFEHPAVADAPALATGVAKLGETEEVLGVVVGGHARAYRLRALTHPTRDIVNDRVGGVPVSVSYCDLTDCARALAGPPGGGSLDVSQAGLFGHEMVLKIAGVDYFHRTGRPLAPEAGAPPLPYQPLGLERTTWAKWTRRHPRTDIYVGLPEDGPDRVGSKKPLEGPGIGSGIPPAPPVNPQLGSAHES